MPTRKLLRRIFTLHHRKQPANNPPRTDPLDTPKPQEAHSQHQSPLFQLPAELRLSIYEYVFTACIGLNPAPRRPHPIRLPRPTRTHIALLQTCQRIHAEALQYVYTCTTFHVVPMHHEFRDVFSIAFAWYAVIRSLRITWVQFDNSKRRRRDFMHLCEGLKREFGGLRELDVSFHVMARERLDEWLGDVRFELEWLGWIDKWRARKVDIRVEVPWQWMREREVREWRGGGRVREAAVVLGDMSAEEVNDYMSWIDEKSSLGL